MTRYLGIIGYPLGHSISPAMQQAALDHLDLDMRYLVWETPPEAIAERMAFLRRPENLGANVTVPHKEAVVPLMDGLDPLARRIGAVNTIVDREGRLLGHNTDAQGFLWALREAGFEPTGKRALLLGAGGAGRAVAVALVEADVESLIIVNRTLGRAEALAGELEPRATALAWDERHAAAATADLIVNATSMGMRGGPAPQESPISASAIPPHALAYDLVYNPMMTSFLAQAERAGARTLGGLAMLVYQGAAAFEIWTGRMAPIEVMMTAAKRALGQ